MSDLISYLSILAMIVTAVIFYETHWKYFVQDAKGDWIYRKYSKEKERKEDENGS